MASFPFNTISVSEKPLKLCTCSLSILTLFYLLNLRMHTIKLFIIFSVVSYFNSFIYARFSHSSSYPSVLLTDSFQSHTRYSSLYSLICISYTLSPNALPVRVPIFPGIFFISRMIQPVAGTITS